MSKSPSNFIDLVGKRFGFLTVIKRSGSRNYKAYWFCRCDCGNEVIVIGTNLRNGNTKSCGCYQKKRASEASSIDLTGKRFGRLTVVKRAFSVGKVVKWECQCDCGNITFVATAYLNNGNSKSCGCLQREKAHVATKTHGMNKSRIHSIWVNMKNRCNNPKNQAYKNYGGRGITYQPSWEKFENFYNDTKEGYADNLTLERIDNDGNYTKDNCRWATKAEQSLNTRHNKIVEYQGKTQTLTQWAEEYNVSLKLLSKRIINGWGFEDALLKPPEEIETYAYNGETKTLKKWACELGIAYNTLEMRLFRGWSIERAFSTPTKTQYRKNK
jgi:hypothetical protein